MWSITAKSHEIISRLSLIPELHPFSSCMYGCHCLFVRAIPSCFFSFLFQVAECTLLLLIITQPPLTVGNICQSTFLWKRQYSFPNYQLQIFEFQFFNRNDTIKEKFLKYSLLPQHAVYSLSPSDSTNTKKVICTTCSWTLRVLQCLQVSVNNN